MAVIDSGRACVRPIYMSINMQETGANLKTIIKSSGFTVREIMLITGISTEQAVYKWYRGESIPSLETLLVLSKVLNKEITELLVIDGEFDFMMTYFILRVLNCGKSITRTGCRA